MDGMSRRQLESAVGDGGVDAAGVARSRTKCSARAAERSSRTARQLKMMPRARKALEQDRIGPEHADAAAEATERTSPEEVDDEFGDSIGDQPADPFGKQARSWANAKERLDEQEARHRRQRAASEAISWTNSDGMWCAFLEFDPDTGKAVEKAWQETTDCLWRPDGGRDGTPASPLSGDGAADATRLRGDRPVGVAEFLDGTPLPQSVANGSPATRSSPGSCSRPMGRCSGRAEAYGWPPTTSGRR